jgi:methylated-DNA-[protein]-cysteine S-methyltransferase
MADPRSSDPAGLALEDRLSTRPDTDPIADPDALAAIVGRAVAAAAAAGDIDVAVGETESPVGPLVLAATDRGLVAVSYAERDEALAWLARRLSPRVVRLPARIDGVRRQLDEYFERRRRDFDVELDWALVTPFQRKVLTATAAIPYGEVATYSDIAAAAGSPGGARATGNALGANPMPVVVPCHRVVHRGGGLGGYTGGLDRKRTLLTVEGTLGELFPVEAAATEPADRQHEARAEAPTDVTRPDGRAG